MIKSIIFDYYGVIRNDPYERWLGLHNLKREGVYREASIKQDSGLIDATGFRDELSRLSGVPSEIITQEFDQGAGLDAQIIELIIQLKDRYKVGLLSNASSDLRNSLKQLNIEKYFDTIIISGEIGLIKPSMEVFKYIIQKLDTPAEQTILIDDSKLNIGAAIKFGLHGIVYSSHHKLISELKDLGVII